MKKLYKLIIKAFIGPFLATFFIALFVLLMQFLWKYIDDLAGKGLEWYVIAELLFFNSASIIPMALPLAILLSSIMTFGNLGENYEMVAIKSAGISFRKILMPMLGMMILLSLIAFFISNIIIPEANLRSLSLLYDVRQQKPAFLIKEGAFYNGIDGFSIKVGKKEKDNETVRDVIIYDHSANKGNNNVLIAESGRMFMSEDKKYLFFTLYNGKRYEEMDPAMQTSKSLPHNIFSFAKEEIIYDLSDFKLSRTNIDLFKDHFQMMNVLDLSKTSDSLGIGIMHRREALRSNLLQFYHLEDTLRKGIKPRPLNFKEKEFISNFTYSKSAIMHSALNSARSVKGLVGFTRDNLKEDHRLRARYDIEWYRKFTLSAACLVLFFIGAPLGTIIRKGGFGMPVVISVILFIIFYILNIMGEKFAKEMVMSPAQGMWLSSLILFPFGVFLTYKASVDSDLFSTDSYVRFFKKIQAKFKKEES